MEIIKRLKESLELADTFWDIDSKYKHLQSAIKLIIKDLKRRKKKNA